MKRNQMNRLLERYDPHLVERYEHLPIRTRLFACLTEIEHHRLAIKQVNKYIATFWPREQQKPRRGERRTQ